MAVHKTRKRHTILTRKEIMCIIYIRIRKIFLSKINKAAISFGKLVDIKINKVFKKTHTIIKTYKNINANDENNEHKVLYLSRSTLNLK
jgi:hypothetical protein